MSERSTHPGAAALGPDHTAARAQAARRLATMRTRATRVRRGIAAFTALVFVCAFLVVYVQLVSGHDPALAAGAKREAGAVSSSSLRTKASASKATTTSAKSASSQTAGGSNQSSTGSAQETSSESSSSSSASSPSAVTTSQS